jgi:hypothetical protein
MKAQTYGDGSGALNRYVLCDAVIDDFVCRKGGCGPGAGPHQEAGGPVHRAPGLPHLPLLRGRHGLRLHLPPYGAPLRRLREKVQARVRHLSCAPGRPFVKFVCSFFALSFIFTLVLDSRT